MSLANVGKRILVKVTTGIVAILCLKAIDNIVDGKDIFGRDPDPKKTRVDKYSGDVYLGTDDYTIV